MAKNKKTGNKKRGGKQPPRRRGRQPRQHRAESRREPSPLETILHDASTVLENGDRRLVERWASVIQALLRPAGFPPEPALDPAALLKEAKRTRSPEAALAARAIAVFGPLDARPEAERLYASLREEGAAPALLDELDAVTPGDVIMLRQIYGDHYSLHLDVTNRTGEVEGVSARIDVNRGGIVTDVIVGPHTGRFIAEVAADPYLEAVPVAPAEARALVEEAFAQLDRTLDPPVEMEVPLLRALVEQRFSLLPAGGAAPEYHELAEGERRAFVEAFSNTLQARQLGDDAPDIAETICDFANYLDGDPLRWSPSVVNIFLLDWLPRKVIADDRWFEKVPDVVRAWVRFAGKRRGLPGELIDETIQAVDECAAEFFEQVGDPDPGGPAGRLLTAMVDAGIDPGDPESVAAFLKENAGPEDGGDDIDDDEFFEAWERLDEQAVSFLREGLAEYRQQPPPIGLARAARQLRDGLREGSWPYDYLISLLDLSPEDIERQGDTALLLEATTAFVGPDGLSTHGPAIDPEELSLAHVLDHATWAFLVTNAVRVGPGVDLSPSAVTAALADTFGNSEETESADDDHFDLVETALQVNAPLWQAVGVTDGEERLTELGAWLLPRALVREWGDDFDAD